MTEINNINKNKLIEVNEISRENNINSNYSDIYNTILENQIQTMAFLTNVPIKSKILRKLKLNSLKNYKKIQNISLNKNSFAENKLIEIGNISFIKTSKTKIDNNILNYNNDTSNSLEKKLNDTLKEIKEQIKLLSNNTEKINIKENQNLVLNLKMNNSEQISIKNKIIENNKNNLKELEDTNKIIKNYIFDDGKNKMDEYLEEKKKEEEIEIIKKKDENDKKVEKLKKFIKTPHRKSIFLYQKMHQNFLEKENKLINDIKTDRKAKFLIYRPQKINIKNNKKDLEKKANEQKNEMKKLWHSRSMILKNFQKYRNKNINQNEETTDIQEENTKNKNNERIEYSKKIKLPSINEKLKEESEFRLIDIKKLNGKKRIDFINKNYKVGNSRKYNKIKYLNYGKVYIQQKNKKNDINNKSNLDEKIERNKRNDISKKLSSKEINYIKDLRNIKKINNHSWIKYIKDKEKKFFDNDGIQNIIKKVENLDEKEKFCKELIKIDNKLENKIELEDKVNDIITDSIKGKLVILDELCLNDN